MNRNKKKIKSRVLSRFQEVNGLGHYNAIFDSNSYKKSSKSFEKKSQIFTTLEKARFYFLHSYYFECESQDSALAETDCGVPFVCAVHSKNIFGVQFHPEKSHQYGTLLLKNFSGI